MVLYRASAATIPLHCSLVDLPLLFLLISIQLPVFATYFHLTKQKKGGASSFFSQVFGRAGTSENPLWKNASPNGQGTSSGLWLAVRLVWPRHYVSWLDMCFYQGAGLYVPHMCCTNDLAKLVVCCL
jgi:hypothetical protein